jgi:hypothetical protein
VAEGGDYWMPAFAGMTCRRSLHRHSGAMPPGPREARPDDRLRIEPQMRNCASGNLEIPGSSLRDAPE